MSLYSFFFPQRAMIKDNKDALREAWRNELIQAMLSAGMSKGKKIEPNYTLFYSEKSIIIRRKEP